MISGQKYDKILLISLFVGSFMTGRGRRLARRKVVQGEGRKWKG